ncbi:hypothetical protein [Streptomyces sp. NPDC029721]|uniref:hypothetical protein n=1 Tax=Streptomyces sp. NPDC029721 TaxID=3157090 RepID=UPI0033F8932C
MKTITSTALACAALLIAAVPAAAEGIGSDTTGIDQARRVVDNGNGGAWGSGNHDFNFSGTEPEVRNLMDQLLAPAN